jgi:preprotein translocase subunit YajC
LGPSILVIGQAAGGPGPLVQVLFFGALFAIMYFLMIRPQAKQLKEHKSLISSLKKGDEVVTQGGLIGRIYAITDTMVTLEIANSVRVRVLKTSVQGRVQAEEPAALAVKAEEKKEEK